MLVSLLVVVDSHPLGHVHRVESTETQSQQEFGSCVDYLATVLGRDYALCVRHNIDWPQTSTD